MRMCNVKVLRATTEKKEEKKVSLCRGDQGQAPRRISVQCKPLQRLGSLHHGHPHRRAGFEPMAPRIGGGQSYTLLIPKSLDQIQYWGGAELKGMTLRAAWWFASCNAGIYTPHPHAQMATKKMIPSLPETSHFRNVVFQKHHVLKT